MSIAKVQAGPGPIHAFRFNPYQVGFRLAHIMYHSWTCSALPVCLWYALSCVSSDAGDLEALKYRQDGNSCFQEQWH